MSTVEEMLKGGFNPELQRVEELSKMTMVSAPIDIKSQDVLRQYLDTDDESKRNNILDSLEEGVITYSDGSGEKNEDLSGEIIAFIGEYQISEQSNTDRPISIKEAEADGRIAFIKECNVQMETYADDLIYGACKLWAEAVEYDERMMQPILKGDQTFFNAMEELGYPHLCLLVKAIK